MPESQRSAVALRHVAFEDLGLLGPILSQNGWSVSYRRRRPTTSAIRRSSRAIC